MTTRKRKARAVVRKRTHEVKQETAAMTDGDEQMHSLAHVAMWPAGAVPALTRAAQAWGHARTTTKAADYLVAADAQEEASLHRAAGVSRRIAQLLNYGNGHDAAVAAASCAYCRNATEGNHSIHRDAFCEGPEVDLCDACGSQETPTERQIWMRIGQREDCIACETEIRSDDERQGSFHAWCV